MKALNKETFLSEDVLFLAQYLLGKMLVSQINGKECVVKIVETEAYKAPEDKGSHAHNNKRTKRTETMFLEGGITYVYLCYGIHNMLNVVTGPIDSAHAILIRAVEPIQGINAMIERRGATGQALTNGPGKLCQALGITRDHNGIGLCNSRSALWIADNESIPDSFILSGPRVGIAYAEECAHWPWRFRVKGNKWTSPPDMVMYE